MDDADLARMMLRVPSLTPADLRFAVEQLNSPMQRLPAAEQLAGLDLVADRAAQAASAILALDLTGDIELEFALPTGQTTAMAVGQLQALAAAAISARHALEERCKAGRPVSDLTRLVWLLALLIETRGGHVDAKQGGELCQAFGVALELLGLSVANHRETVRAALQRRPAKQ